MNTADGWKRQDTVHPAIIPCPSPSLATLIQRKLLLLQRWKLGLIRSV